MDMHNLVHMANRIGTFFESMPHEDEALLGLAEHLRKFWPPLMRTQLLAHIASQDTSTIHPLVLKAVQQHAHELRPVQPQVTPTAPH